jgi:hypothetical protein
MRSVLHRLLRRKRQLRKWNGRHGLRGQRCCLHGLHRDRRNVLGWHLSGGFCWIVGRQLGGLDGRVVERKLGRPQRRLKLRIRKLGLWALKLRVRKFGVWKLKLWVREFGVWGLWFRVGRQFQLRRAPARRRLKTRESRGAPIMRPATRAPVSPYQAPCPRRA